MGRETDRRVRAPFPPQHEVLSPQKKPGTVIPPLPEPHSHVHPRWHQGGGRLCRQSQHQPSSPYRGSPRATSPPWSPPGMLRTSPPQGPAAEEQHPSIELVSTGCTGPAKGPHPSESGSAGWSVIIHAGLGGRWLLGPDNIFWGKEVCFWSKMSVPTLHLEGARRHVWLLRAFLKLPPSPSVERDGRQQGGRKGRKQEVFPPERLSGLNPLKN